MDNNVFYLVAGRQGGIILCHWPTKYKYIEINYISRFLVDDIVHKVLKKYTNNLVMHEFRITNVLRAFLTLGSPVTIL